jgi:hypothetical protein
MTEIDFLSAMSVEDVRARMRAFSDSYKGDWRQWIAVAQSAPLDSPATATAFRDVLRSWQAVRSKTKGRVVRPCRAATPSGELCMEELLAEALAYVKELGDFTLRDAATPSSRQARALKFLWEVFRALPTSGTANAVGITKAVKLVTLGRVGPALDTVVRDRLNIEEPRSGEDWVAVLGGISGDLLTFEKRRRVSLEDLVDKKWRPVAVGRAYDMVAGPTGRKNLSHI